MEITSKSVSSFQIKGKQVTLLINPRDLSADASAVILTNGENEFKIKEESVRLFITGPGEYEIGGASIAGRKIDGENSFRIVVDGVSVLYLAHAPQDKSKLEAFSPIDIIILGEYVNSIYELDPKIIVPFTKEVGEKLGKDVEIAKKLIMTKEKLPPDLKVVILHG